MRNKSSPVKFVAEAEEEHDDDDDEGTNLINNLVNGKYEAMNVDEDELSLLAQETAQELEDYPGQAERHLSELKAILNDENDPYAS